MIRQDTQDTLILRDIYGHRHRNLARAVSSRLLLLAHACVAVWITTEVYSDVRFWGLLPCSLVLFAVEGIVTVHFKKGREWQWFCPSFFCYLITVIPCLWIQRLTLFGYINAESTQKTIESTTETSSDAIFTTINIDNTSLNDLDQTTPQFWENSTFTAVASGYRTTRLNYPVSYITLPIIGTTRTEVVVSVIEQSMMVVIIFGRWLLPRGYFSRGVLSQLLLVYLSLFADIMDFSELGRIRDDHNLCILVTGFWSLSLCQFCFVVVSKKESKSIDLQTSPEHGETRKRDRGDIFGLICVCLMHDGPFLIVRLLILIKYHEINNTIIFFLCKNVLTLVLLSYRLLIVGLCISQHSSESLVLENYSELDKAKNGKGYKDWNRF